MGLVRSLMKFWRREGNNFVGVISSGFFSSWKRGFENGKKNNIGKLPSMKKKTFKNIL